jgi:LPXTG-motif cell wall-anchored protein
MRKNVKQQFALRVLSTAALMAMVSSIATAAFAAEYNVKDGSVEIVAKDGVQSITQWADKDEGTYVTDDKGAIKDREDSNIILTTKNKDTGETETTSNTVTITAENKGDTANVTLKDVDIESSSKWSSDPAPIEIKGNGNTNLELNGNNTVFSGNKDHAGIEKADVNGTGTLTIKDDVNDDSSEKTGTEADTTGKLVAGGFYNGAAIGGGGTDDTASTSNIRITGGDITASGGYYGAGIGAGCYGDASNIRIEGNAHVTAFADGSAAIGSGYHARGNSDITITDHATVEAAGLDGCAIGSGHDSSDKVTITISGNASVNAQTRNSPAAIGSDESSATVNIEDHADVTAVGYGVAIGTGYGRDSNEYHGATSTVINITGGTVNAVTRGRDSKPAIGTVYGNLDLTINSSTGKTTVNAYTTGSDSLPLIGTADHYDSSTHKYDSISPSEGAEYNEDGSSNLGEDNAAIINSYRNTTLSTGIYNAPETLDDSAFHPTLEFQGTIYRPKRILSGKGDLTKVVHNRKYMDENPNIDTKKLEDEDLHDWKLVGKVVEPTLEKDGGADYICSIDKCGQTKHVVLPKLTPEPSEPDVPGGNTPDTPNKPDVPSTPEVTPADPAVTPDAPAQDGTAPADTLTTDTTADAAVAPAAAQNVAQNAEPEAAAAASTAAPAVLPQTGANWLAVVGTALSGLFLLAAGFVLDRKNRRMN